MSRFSGAVIALLCLIQLLIVWWVRDVSFFWDTIQLVSYDAHWFFYNGYFAWPMPEWMDSGNPPFMGWLLALVWGLFGRSLAVSHAFMLPFLCANAVLVFLLIRDYLKGSLALLFTLCWLVFPVYAGQSSLISPDVLLMTGFFTALYAWKNGYYRLQAVGLLFMAMISLRGMMLTGAFFLAQLIYQKRTGTAGAKSMLNEIMSYLPAVLIILVFGISSVATKGWIGVHTDSPWVTSFQWAGIEGVIQNTTVLGFRMVENGFVFVLAMGGWILYKNGIFRPRGIRPAVLAAAYLMVFLPLFLFAENLIAHRYLLPLYFCLFLWCVRGIAQTLSGRKSRYLLGISLLIAFSFCNRIVYPDKLAQGWDATLAYLPYDGLRKQAIRRIDQRNIALQEVGSWFPNRASLKYIDLNDREKQFAHFDLGKNKYFLYSNIYNSVPDRFIDELTRSRHAVFQVERAGIKMELYKNPSFDAQENPR